MEAPTYKTKASKSASRGHTGAALMRRGSMFVRCLKCRAERQPGGTWDKDCAKMGSR